MRISDWSSDVCSSDLIGNRCDLRAIQAGRGQGGDGDWRRLKRLAGTAGSHDDIFKTVRFRRITDRVGFSGRCGRSEEHTSELQSLMRISYAVFCLKKKTRITYQPKQ